MSDPVSKTTERRPLAQVPLAKLPRQLRLDADEMNGCGAGNEAEHARQAADELERLQAALNQAYRIMCSGTPPHSARETNARRVLRLAGVTAKEQSA